jgi:hypothetical protein
VRRTAVRCIARYDFKKENAALEAHSLFISARSAFLLLLQNHPHGHLRALSARDLGSRHPGARDGPLDVGSGVKGEKFGAKLRLNY